jgi:hypothetical protein
MNEFIQNVINMFLGAALVLIFGSISGIEEKQDCIETVETFEEFKQCSKETSSRIGVKL